MKRVKEKLQKLLYSGEGTKFIKGDNEYDLLYKTLLLHPKHDVKIGEGVDYFFIQKSKWKHNQFNFMIKRLDGSDVDFSFYKCVHNMPNISWNKIFREVIKPQINEFRNEAFKVLGVTDKFICSHTNLKYKKIYAHVDHVYPLTFDSIFSEFIMSRNINVNKLELTEDLGTSEIQMIVNQDIRDDFYKFHENRAVLRLVVSTANLQGKNTKNYNGNNPTTLKEELKLKYPQYHIK